MQAAMASRILTVHLDQVMMNNPCFMMITTLILLHLLILIPFANPLSFNFTTFTTNDLNITYESSAYAANNAIQLTTNQRDLKTTTTASIGRASYAKPIHLWDKSSGNLTDFSTNFSFSINSLNVNFYGDGLAFFIAPNGLRIPDNVTKGGSMGLTPDDEALNSTNNPFVAVEFDIYSNKWDPWGEHVGIDISSMRSVANVSWRSASSIMEGRRHEARINYDSGSRNLSLEFTAYINDTSILGNDTRFWQSLSYIVDLREHLPELVTIGFSAATGNATALHSIYSWSFSSSLEINDTKTDPEISMGPTSDSGFHINAHEGSRPSGNKTGLLIGSVVGGCVCLVGLGLFVFVVWKKRMRKMNESGDETYDVSIGDEFEMGTGPKKFSYNDLARATNKFSQQEKLGEGGFGGVYKGMLKELDSYVAVKRVSKGSSQGIKEYASEVRIISRLRHRNLVQLLGWCHEKKELLLVYEFMPNGSLDSHLFKGRSLLSWGIRFKIAQGLASALLYLHEEWEQCVVHRDIKSSNIMLDSNFNAKLGDFGLARLVDHEKGSQTTVLAGTMGYMAPECVITGRASKETDVFSFGVVTLEICCGKKPIEPKAPNGEVNLIDWVWSLYGKGKLLEAADPLLESDFSVREIERLMIVGLWCAHPDSDLRPSIRQAILVLNFEAPLPDLPLKMPVPTYCTPALDKASSPYGTVASKYSEISSSLNSENTESSKFTASSGPS
ncbi:hypothetical protein BUALT_Bualt15G0056000 [Buddleja alternifolia]|uniref:Protein kinase domain-containing protein n=1 Tax=Buddleja alternifolia TaxID=168488 RepID=A0AAV6WEB2_9LAMI|nr:hypothetical protein BUALT_Bualt15G0056000 [Buddleja alternifolia]